MGQVDDLSERLRRAQEKSQQTDAHVADVFGRIQQEQWQRQRYQRLAANALVILVVIVIGLGLMWLALTLLTSIIGLLHHL